MGGRRGKDTSLLSQGDYEEGLCFYTVPCFAFLVETVDYGERDAGSEQGWLLLGREG